jgi:hypothetical protein
MAQPFSQAGMTKIKSRHPRGLRRSSGAQRTPDVSFVGEHVTDYFDRQGLRRNNSLGTLRHAIPFSNYLVSIHGSC